MGQQGWTPPTRTSPPRSLARFSGIPIAKFRATPLESSYTVLDTMGGLGAWLRVDITDFPLSTRHI